MKMMKIKIIKKNRKLRRNKIKSMQLSKDLNTLIPRASLRASLPKRGRGYEKCVLRIARIMIDEDITRAKLGDDEFKEIRQKIFDSWYQELCKSREGKLLKGKKFLNDLFIEACDEAKYGLRAGGLTALLKQADELSTDDELCPEAEGTKRVTLLLLWLIQQDNALEKMPFMSGKKLANLMDISKAHAHRILIRLREKQLIFADDIPPRQRKDATRYIVVWDPDIEVLKRRHYSLYRKSHIGRHDNN